MQRNKEKLKENKTPIGLIIDHVCAVVGKFEGLVENE